MIYSQRPPTHSHRNANPRHTNDYYPHRYGALSSPDSSLWPDAPEDPSSYFYPHYSNHPYVERQTSLKSSSSRRLSFQSSNRRNSYHASLSESNNHSRSSHHRNEHLDSYGSQQDPMMVDRSTMQADEDEDEDDLITPREAEAIRNAELNKVVEAITSAATITTTNPVSNAKDMPTELNMMEPLTGENTDMPTVSPPSTPQQQHMAPPHTASLRQRKRDKVIYRLTSFLRRFGTPKKQPQRQQQKGSIQTMWATSPIGDILDAQQQKEIMHMLQTDGSPKNGHPTPNEDATKVAKLDYIWVFRSADDSTLWTGFDYRNQIKLSKHSGDDEGIEVYDTHIKHGQLPILVIPKRKVCFYAPSDVSDQVASLQVACLPNSKSTQFVYRCGPMP